MTHLRIAPARLTYAIFSALLLLSVTAPAHAAKKHPEIYPAVEDEIDGTPIVAAPPTKKAKSSLSEPKKTEKAIFDSVPPEQVEGISNRLKLVDVLLKKYGRAYDYRIHTVKELENILAKLDGPAPGDAEPNPPEPTLPEPPKAAF